MGMKQLPKRSGEYLFEIIMRRYETRSTIMTSNRPLEDWGKLLGDVPSATAILDRFLHHAEIVQVTGKSYRLQHRGAPGSNAANAPLGSEAEANGSNAASAHAADAGTKEAPTGSNAAKAPMRSKTARDGQQTGGSRPLNARESADAPGQENVNTD